MNLHEVLDRRDRLHKRAIELLRTETKEGALQIILSYISCDDLEQRVIPGLAP